MKDKIVDKYDAKNNSFTLVSIIMSLLIIYFHCYPLFYGPTTSNYDLFTKHFGLSLGEVVVGAFFAISGFMIVTSLQKSKNTWEYLKKRFIKIFPPLVFCLLVCALVIAPILSDIPKLDFIKNVNIYKRYIIDNILLWRNTQYGIADVFIGNPYPSAINGSLWTIKHQFFMYILILGINIALLKKKPDLFKYFYGIILVLTMVSFTGKFDSFYADLLKNHGTIGILAEGNQVLKLICYFCTGIFLNIYKDKISLKKEYFIYAIVILILARKTIVFRCLSLFLIPYIIIYIGSLKNKIKFKIPDISYQVYLWAFPIQQMLMYYLNGKIGIYSYIALSIIITCVVGYCTYYITELPFKLKRSKKNEIN